MDITLAQVAKASKKSKMTVIRTAQRLGIYDDMAVKGPNNTRVMTDEQALVLGQELAGKAFTVADLGGAADIDLEAVIALNTEIAELKSALAASEKKVDERDAQITDLGVTIDKKDAEIERCKAEIAILRRMRQEDQDCIAGLMGAWPWQKRKILADHKREIKDLSAKLLPPAAMAQGPADQVADAVYETPGGDA